MRVRLILSFVLVVIVSITVLVLVAREGAANEVQAFMFRGGMTDSTDIVESLEDYYRQNGTWIGAESFLVPPGQIRGKGQSRSSGMMGQRLQLADRNGTVVFDTENSSTGSQLAPSDQLTAITLDVRGENVGFLVPEGGMGFTGEQGQQLIERLNRGALTAAVIAGALSLILALFLAYRLLRPVNELNTAAHQLGEGDLSQRVPVRGHDELANLGRSFNQMADSLEQSEESRRAMTADIAHELRNPLAVQRANLEALMDGIYPLTPENLQPAIEQNVFLTRLVEDLRTIALADSGELDLDLVGVNFNNLTERVIERYRAQAQTKRIKLSYLHQSLVDTNPYIITADPTRVEQILSNLLANALRYTPEGGEVAINLTDKPEYCQITIHDSGPGIPEEALPNIFDRFYRADRSRSRSDGGSGLGLAIARQFVEAHGGSLTAENHPMGGAVFTIVFPRSIENE